MKRILLAMALCVSLLVNAGCVPLVFVAVGGAGAYIVSKDTIQGETDIAYETLWESAIMVSKYRGSIQKQLFDKGTIEMMEGKAKVWITLERLTQSTTRLRVASRRYKMPNLELAQLIYTKIIDQAKPAK